MISLNTQPVRDNTVYKEENFHDPDQHFGLLNIFLIEVFSNPSLFQDSSVSQHIFEALTVKYNTLNSTHSASHDCF